MARDIPLELRTVIADYSDMQTIASLRLVSRSWCQIDPAPLFRSIRLRVGREDDLKRHEARAEQLWPTISRHCDEIDLDLSACDSFADLCQDLDLIASKLGGRIRTLVLCDATWEAGLPGALSPGFEHPIEDVDFSCLFPANRALRLVSMCQYTTAWLMGLVSSWPELEELEVTEWYISRPLPYGGCDSVLPSGLGLVYLMLGGDCKISTIMEGLLRTRSVGTLQRLDLRLEMNGYYDTFLSIVALLDYPSSMICDLRLSFSAGINPRYEDEGLRKWNSLNPPHMRSLVLHWDAPLLYPDFVCELLDATHISSLEHLRLVFSLEPAYRNQHYSTPYQAFKRLPTATLNTFPCLKSLTLCLENWEVSLTDEERMAITKAPLFAEAQARGMLSIACTLREE